MTRSSNLIVAVVVIAGIALVLRAASRAMRRYFEGLLLKRAAVAQHSVFILLFRDRIFHSPQEFSALLSSSNARWLIQKLWQEAGSVVAKRVARSDGAGRIAEGPVVPEAPDPNPGQLRVEQRPLTDGRLLVIVILPQTGAADCAYMIGVVMPPPAQFKQDFARARKRVRYFTGGPGSTDTSRTTDFCERTASGRVLTYNIASGKTPNEFAATIVAKLSEG